MNSVQDDVGLDYQLYKRQNQTDFEGRDDVSPNTVSPNDITKISFGKSVVDRLDYEHTDGTIIKYFNFVGESQKITYKDTIFTTKKQNHYLWKDKVSDVGDKNVYHNQIQRFVNSSVNGNDDTHYSDLGRKIVGTLELNFVPEYKGTSDVDVFDMIKILIPIFKTKRINKQGLELLNCIRTSSDVAIPTKNIDMSDFIPKKIPYLINNVGVNSKSNSEEKCADSECDSSIPDLKLGVFIFTSSNIHLDKTMLQPSFFNSIDQLEKITIGYLWGGDVMMRDFIDDDRLRSIKWVAKGIQYVSSEKKCTELYNEGETLKHSVNKLINSSMKKMPLAERIGQMIKSPIGLMVVIIMTFSVILACYKLIMNIIVSNIGETSQSQKHLFRPMSKAGAQSSLGAWIVFVLVFVAYAKNVQWMP
jgi:hypothetical protein